MSSASADATNQAVMPSADGTTQAATVNDPGSGSVAERPLAVNAPHIKHNLPSASDLAIAKTKATLAKTEAAQKVAGAWKATIASGAFDDGNVAPVHGLDDVGGPGAHDTNAQK